MTHPDADPIAEAEALKPCPFCGGTDILVGIERIGVHEDGQLNCVLVCQGCGARSPIDEREAVCKELWNRRADDDAEARGYRRGLEAGIAAAQYEIDKWSDPDGNSLIATGAHKVKRRIGIAKARAQDDMALGPPPPPEPERQTPQEEDQRREGAEE